MEQSDQEFWQITRNFLIRYNEYNREKGVAPTSLQDFDSSQAKMLSQQQLKEAAITRLTTLEFKSDYHNLILLAFLIDLAKWTTEYYDDLRLHPAPLEALVTQSIQVLNNQQHFHTLVAKQNELIVVLLPLPYTLSHIDQFKILFRKLKDVKDFFPNTIREHQKKCFISAIQQTIDRAHKEQNIKIIEFIFANLFHQLQNLDIAHQSVCSRLKIVKKISKRLWVFHTDIIYKIAYLLMKFSYHVPNNSHLYCHLLPIYHHILPKLTDKPSITALFLFKHLILNNIEILLRTRGNCLLLQGLLDELSKLFTKKTLEYFMRHYDWNYLEVGICQQTLNMLYEYCQNRSFEKKPQFQLVKNCLNRIHTHIKRELDDLKGLSNDESKWKFYQLKKKEYFELVVEMNESPKKLFKKIANTVHPDVQQSMIQKYVKLIKKSSHLQNKAMINLLASEHQISGQLFRAYAELMLKQCTEHNLEEFIRMFTSNFFLTGQSQQIARILDTITLFFFSKQEEDHRVLSSSNATYTFANAILILNTDLHNPKNQQKMSEEAFLKMCKKINQGEDLPTQMIKKTYSNIKRNKINTFRDRGNMLGISIENWLALCNDDQSLPLLYYDPELEALDQSCLQYYIYDILSSKIDEKQTAKLQLLVQHFAYDDKIYQCQIIQVIRKVIDKKPHLPLHILQKILEHANFKNSRPSQKTLSYYWLSANLITTFAALIPTNIICQFLVLTWQIRNQLQDNMYLRLRAQTKRVKQCIKNVTKRQAKKSIMDMFSNFLSFKESDDQEPLPSQFSKRTNFKSISNNIFDILKYHDNHLKFAVQFLINYIHNEQSKVYQQFLSCLFLTFNLLYIMNGCQQTAQDLFYELLGVKESSITKRLANLGKKDSKLFNILTSYCKFWILKLLLKEYRASKVENKENNCYEYMLKKSLQCLQKVDSTILQDFIKQIQGKPSIYPPLMQSFEKSIHKVYGNNIEAATLLQKLKNQNKEKPSNGVQEIIEQPEASKDKENKESEKEKQKEPQKQQEKQVTSKQEDKDIERNQVEQNKASSLDELPDKDIQNKVDLQVNQKVPETPLKRQQVEQEKQDDPIEEQNKVKETKDKQNGILENHLPKRQSIEPVGLVNPDQVIEQIDRQIESHMNSKIQYIETSKQEHAEIVQKVVQEEEKKDEREQQGQQGTSIPVIMF